ncbi:MAG: branched-chain amino acid transaminase [Bacillati bacterium ANGP1]|uniref:Branched-chain-amino-acid aminotransferase n=1 Tax=Candidatus Segetimicrobium genomatis TaxID=2569760 RepID=A0A537J0U6_9BACT|nr:MAG: branched-chain amino acid transaminase [Terrabacteria group bacterium ANGP1]
MNSGKYIWFNGKLVPADEAKVSVMAQALHYGSSVFEGIRAYATSKGPEIFCLPPHVRRMFDSCRIFRMELPYTAAEMTDAITETVRINQFKECYIRPIAFRGAGSFSLDPRKSPVEVAVITVEWGRYLGAEAIEQGVDVMVSSWRRMAPDTGVPMGKIGGQYVTSQLITMEAADLGYAEGIALDASGFISEGSGENIFVVKDGEVYTPPLTSAILPGVTRGVILTLCRDLGITVREQPLLRDILYVADEVFFTGTAAEVTPIRSVDRIRIGSGRGQVTKRIQEEFFGITEGRKPDRHNWLTLVTEKKSIGSIGSVESVESGTRT